MTTTCDCGCVAVKAPCRPYCSTRQVVAKDAPVPVTNHMMDALNVCDELYWSLSPPPPCEGPSVLRQMYPMIRKLSVLAPHSHDGEDSVLLVNTPGSGCDGMPTTVEIRFVGGIAAHGPEELAAMLHEELRRVMGA